VYRRSRAGRQQVPPGPSYRSCTTDSLPPYQIQQTDTLLAPCHPALLDTVLGVKGIIIGFDAKASAYAVYFQNSQGGDFTGVQAFTGATNYNASPFLLALGDSIAVYGTTQEFPASNGTTEIEGPDVIQSTNDIIIRRISSGNPLPPFRISTTTELNWVPSSSGNQGERREATLVRLRGPLKVGRNVGQGGLPALPFNSFLIVNPGSPGDSTLIDGNTLTTVTPPAPGTNIDSIQGIVFQNTTLGVNSYRVQIRNGNDMFLAVAPNLTDAYPIDDTFAAPYRANRAAGTSNLTLRLVFDRNVDVTTAEIEGNYGLGSGIDGSIVDLATVEGGSGQAVQLQITSVRTDGDIETVSAVDIGSQTCPLCIISPQQQRTFVNGVLKCADVQRPDPTMLPVYDDRSRFAGPGTTLGTRLSFRGVGIGQYGSLYYLEDADAGLRGGLSVFGPTAPLVRGHKYLIAGQVQEFGTETEVVSTVYIVDEGLAAIPAARVVPGHIFAEPSPTIIPVGTQKDTTTDLTQSVLTGEDYEGMLIQLHKVSVSEQRNVGQSWFVRGTKAETGDTTLVSNLNGVLSTFDPPDSNMTIDVTGVQHIAFGSFRICPRDAADVVELGFGVDVPSGDHAALDLSVFPNPSRTANVSFTLPTRGQVDIGVFDLAGRRVATVARGVFDPGPYSRQWNGLDAAGKAAGPGVYFYRLKFGAETRVVRAVRLN